MALNNRDTVYRSGLDECPCADMIMTNADRTTSGTKQTGQKELIGFISLVSSGVVSAVGFILIASQRWALFDHRLAAFIILFVQWQLLGFTIAKIGIENLIFAVVSSNQHKQFAAAAFIRKTVTPVSALFSLVMGFVFTPWAGFVAFGSILLDTYSLIISADLNARGQYKITSIANLINYPLFFVFLFGFNYAGLLNAELALTTFLFSSLARVGWLTTNVITPVPCEKFSSAANLQMGIQQVFNFLLFRIDQIILALIGLRIHFDEQISLYVYMAKFPEILASGIVILGTVAFPKVFIVYPFTRHSILGQCKRYQHFLLGYILLFVLLIMLYASFWNGRSNAYTLALPFLFNALLILFANNVIYSMLRQGHLRKLIINLCTAIVIGAVMSLFLLNSVSIYLLSWIVPLQVLTFLILSLNSDWGKSIELHA